MKLVINRCYGGFGLSQEAYRWLIDHGVPVRPYIGQKRDPETGLFKPEPRNDGDCIFDYEHPETVFDDGLRPESFLRLVGRFSDSNGWLRAEGNRSHPLLVAVVEALGNKANGRHAKLAVVEIPDGVSFEIDDFYGMERVHETHRSWA